MADNKFNVSGDQYYTIDGIMCDIKRQLRSKSGSSLDPKKVILALQRIDEGKFSDDNFEITPNTNIAKNVLHILANLSFQDRIVRGKYDWVNSDITEKNFPTNVPADYSTECKIFRFNRVISSEEAIEEMEKEGFRPGTLVELLAYGEAYPEMQKEFPIVGLGSSWRDVYGNRLVPVLRYDVVKRRLRLFWFGNDWHEHDRFLSVSK